MSSEELIKQLINLKIPIVVLPVESDRNIDSNLIRFDNKQLNNDETKSETETASEYELEGVNPSHDRYIVSFKENVDIEVKIKNLDKKMGFKSKHNLGETIKGCTATINKGLMNELLDDPDVNYIEKDAVLSNQIHDKVECPEITSMVAATPLWHQVATNTVLIDTDNYSVIHCYVVDTGILPNHVEFLTGQVLLDYNSITQTKNAKDDNGHGTGVASLIGGKSVGVAYKTTLHAIKVLDSTGSGYTSDIIAGLNWIVKNKKTPAVINMSLGGSYSVSLSAAVQNCIINNITVVCASGNSGVDAGTSSPANTVGAIAVSAYDENKTRPTWSNYGAVVSSFAPGVSVRAAWGDYYNSYFFVSGTSFSCPILSAIIIRYLKAMPYATQSQIITFLMKSNKSNEITNPGANTPNLRIVWDPLNIKPC